MKLTKIAAGLAFGIFVFSFAALNQLVTVYRIDGSSTAKLITTLKPGQIVEPEDVSKKPQERAATTPEVITPTNSKRISAISYSSENNNTVENLVYKTFATVNDPGAGETWESDINLPAARDTAQGSYTPKVAVIDSGVALNHEDFGDIWLSNAGEFGSTSLENPSEYNCSDQSITLDLSCNLIDDDFDGIIDNESGATTVEHASKLNCSDAGLPLDKSCNLIDDDDNGLIDDYRGFDFINFDRSVEPGETNSVDSSTHGTLVTGLIAATNNNNLGIAGIAENVQILPIQALDDEGYGYSISVADSIMYAISRDVDIITLSLGSYGTDSYLEYAVNQATKAGITIVAASGNDGCEGCIAVPAAYSPVIAVGATSDPSTRASFSSYGSALDITAPGVNIYSTAWDTSTDSSVYAYASGTSFATPITTGVLARIISQNENLSPIELKAMLFESSNKDMLATNDNHDIEFGYGFLDSAALTNRAITPLAAEQIISFDSIRSGSALSGQYDRSEIASSPLAYECLAGQKPTTSVYKLTKSGKFAFTISQAERELAIDNGFSVIEVFKACVLQQHDTPRAIRTINLSREIDQSSIKNLFN